MKNTEKGSRKVAAETTTAQVATERDNLFQGFKAWNKTNGLPVEETITNGPAKKLVFTNGASLSFSMMGGSFNTRTLVLTGDVPVPMFTAAVEWFNPSKVEWTRTVNVDDQNEA